jgi:Peptidase family C25/Propeptide_C25
MYPAPLEEERIVVLRLLRASLVIMVLGVGVRPASAQLQWKVVASNADHLELLLEVRGARLIDAGQDASGRSWQEVELGGAHQTGEPGLPLLPRAAKWLALPPEGDATLEVQILERQMLGAARLKPHSTPDIDKNAMDHEPRLIERHIESPNYNSYSTSDASVVRLGEPVFQRRQRMAPVQVSPVIYDAATGRVEVVTRIRVKVKFPRARQFTPEPGQVAPALRAGLLNAGVAASWRCLDPELAERRKVWDGEVAIPRLQRARRAAGTSVFDKAALRSAEIRLRVGETALQRVRMSTLITDHQLPATTLRRDLRLYQKRADLPTSPTYPTPITADVPLHFVGNPDENLPVDPSDVLVFYGISAQDDWDERIVGGDVFPNAFLLPDSQTGQGGVRPDHYNSSNVYWLAAIDPDGGNWARMLTDSFGASSGLPASSFRRTKTFTGDVFFQESVLNPAVERYFWNKPLDREVLRSVPVFAAVAGTQVDFTWTVTRSTPDLNEWPVDFYVEGLSGRIDLQSVDVSTGIYRVLSPVSASVASEDIPDGFVRFGMEHLINGSPGSVGALLGSIEVGFQSGYRAAFSTLEFDTGQPGVDVDIEAVGFERDDLLLYEITDPRAPRAVRLAAENVVDLGDGTFTLSVRVPQAPGEQRVFHASPENRINVLRNQDLETDLVPSVFDTANDLQVLAVGPEFFRPAMDSWVQWRESHDLGYGWTVGYVDVQQIYDDFSGGMQSPWAIHDFVEYAYTLWGAQALLLVGDANEDARGVGADAGPNLVPARLHLQRVLNVYELLASDKWYGFMGATAAYPAGIRKTADLLVGRLPAGNVAELQVMLDKIYAYEQPRADDIWRSRSYWIADDAYSSSYLGAAVGSYGYTSIELEFGLSQDRSASTASASLDSVQQGIFYNVDEVTKGCRDDGLTTLGAIAQCFAQRGTPRLFEAMSQGWLMVSYQGHAAFNVLAHEAVLKRNNLDPLLNNTGRPFLFFGMGCHVSDFLQAQENRLRSPIGEQILELPGRGAIATYGSSGFEFLYPNASFMEEIGSTFWDDGRATGMVGGNLASQWMVGEALAQAELNIMGTPRVSQKDRMVAQYLLLGDPLLRMDAAPPRLRAQLPSGNVSDEAELVADLGSNTATFSIEAIDETGISRLDIVDSRGRDSSSLAQSTPGADPRRRSMSLSLPIYPQTYEVEFSLFDGSYPETRPTTLTLNVTLGTDIFVDGAPFDPGAGEGFPVGRSLAIEIRLTSPIDLSAADIGAVTLAGGSAGTVTATGSGRQWTLRFDATAESATGQTLSLELAGVTEDIPLSSGPGGGEQLAIEAHYPVPNPARLNAGQPIYVVARASEAVQWARLTVYDLSGRLVYSARDDNVSPVGSDFSLSWDGRSPDGAEVANGTYFYRLAVGAGTRTAQSDMGRIVVMR